MGMNFCSTKLRRSVSERRQSRHKRCAISAERCAMIVYMPSWRVTEVQEHVSVCREPTVSLKAAVHLCIVWSDTGPTATKHLRTIYLGEKKVPRVVARESIDTKVNNRGTRSLT